MEDTAEAFANRVADLLTDSERAVAIGQRARAYVEQSFTWEQSKRALEWAFRASQSGAG